MMEKFALVEANRVEPDIFPWGRLYWYVSGSTGSSGLLTFGKCVLNPLAANPRHYHPNCEEVLHVACGRIEHFIEDEGWLPMSTGDTITIAAGKWHCARNLGDEEAELFISFSSAFRETVGE